MLAVLFAACSPCVPQDAGEVVAHWQARLEALARADARHETFASVGRRLWITRDDARPGLRGQAHWLHHTPELSDLLAIEFTADSGRLLETATQQRVWRPTDSELVQRLGAARLREQRWITPDDVYVWRGELTGPLQATASIRSRLTPRPGGDLERFRPVDLERQATFDLGRELLVGRLDAPMFAEGERPRSQRGSKGRDRKGAASGGEVLGSDFGGARGHRAIWRFAGDGRIGWTLLLRYARAAATPALWQVDVSGSVAGELVCAPTGGWGEREQDLAWARLDLPALPLAPFDLALTAKQDGANTNVDGLLLVRREQVERLPPPAEWPALDPLRGAVDIVPGQHAFEGVPVQIAGSETARAVPLERPVMVPAEGGVLHVLALRFGTAPRLTCGGREVALPDGRGPSLVSLRSGAAAQEQLFARDALLLAVTHERTGDGVPLQVRTGNAEFHGVPTELQLSIAGLPADRRIGLAEGERLVITMALEFCGGALPGAATQAVLAEADPLAAHRRREALWYARHCPRLLTEDPLFAQLWTYRCFLLRHNLAEPRAGHLGSGPVFYEGRHGSWYPRVITFSTPHIVAEARWLADPALWRGNVEAHLRHLAADGELPNLLVNWTGFRYSNWIGAAAVEALQVHPDPSWLREWLPALVRNTEGIAKLYDRDGDGVLCTGDHYTTGMEFQPSFWFHDGYDNRKPQADLERPDLTAYVFGNAKALAAASRWLDDEATATRLEALAAQLRDSSLRKLWHRDDRFFYSIRERDDLPARAREVVGFYPFRFELPPDQPEFRAALSYLVSPAEFWTAFPVASCSKQVPVYSAAVQRWPGPGGLVTACMWNGPTWPHANSLAADTLAVALRRYGPCAVQPEHLGTLMRQFARFHCEEGDPARPLLREYGDGETGVNWGCADYLHSTWLDLWIRHVAGLVPRADDRLEIRPLPLGLGDFELQDVRYHGRRIGIRLRAGNLTATVDGAVAGSADAAAGIVVPGALAIR